MPSGKIEEVEEVEDLTCDGISPQQKELNDLLKIDKKKDDKKKENDPMDFPPEYTYLMKELGNKGGIRMENCQEINVISHTIYESDLDKVIKESCIKVMEHMVNYSNLWIIHYNKHKT